MDYPAGADGQQSDLPSAAGKRHQRGSRALFYRTDKKHNHIRVNCSFEMTEKIQQALHGLVQCIKASQRGSAEHFKVYSADLTAQQGIFRFSNFTAELLPRQLCIKAWQPPIFDASAAPDSMI